MLNSSQLNLDYDSVNIYGIDNNFVYVGSKNDIFMESLRRFFTNKMKNARFIPSVMAGNWDGNIRFLKNNNSLPKGLLPECINHLKEREIPYHLSEDLKNSLLNIDDFETIIRKELIEKQKTVIEPWEHQWELAKALINSKRGIIRAATSSGKSYVITMAMKYLLYKQLVNKILLVVPRLDLVSQFHNDCINFGFDEKDLGKFYGGEKNLNSSIRISTWQSLQNVSDPQFFHEFDCLIIDECHLSGISDKNIAKKNPTTILRKICDQCINATWRLGCTGTMPKDILDIRTVVGGLGPVVKEVTAVNLMQKGHVTKLKIIAPFISYDKETVRIKIREYLSEMGISDDTPKKDIDHRTLFAAERRFIENYVPRFKMIGNIVKSRLEKNENILILANTVEYGKNLVKIIEYMGKGLINKIEHIYGEIDEKKRIAIREEMERSERIIIVATTSLFSTGISVKKLHCVLFANIGKSEIQVLQSIGRSLRIHETKDVATVYDISDNLRYNAKQAQERFKSYASEDFDLNIMEINL